MELLVIMIQQQGVKLVSEIKTKLIQLESGQNYRATGDDFVITENHSFNDVCRWLVDQSSVEDVKYILEQVINKE